MRVENQQYIHYNKGSLVMYLLQDRLGEAAVNRAIRIRPREVQVQGRALSALDRAGRGVPPRGEDRPRTRR